MVEGRAFSIKHGLGYEDMAFYRFLIFSMLLHLAFALAIAKIFSLQYDVSAVDEFHANTRKEEVFFLENHKVATASRPRIKNILTSHMYTSQPEGSIKKNSTVDFETNKPVMPQLDLQYFQELQKFIEKNKSYPKIIRELGIRGKVLVEVNIDSSGNFSKIKIVESSGNSALDNAALHFIKNLQNFSPPPKELVEEQGKNSIDVRVPIEYN